MSETFILLCQMRCHCCEERELSLLEKLAFGELSFDRRTIRGSELSDFLQLKERFNGFLERKTVEPDNKHFNKKSMRVPLIKKFMEKQNIPEEKKECLEERILNLISLGEFSAHNLDQHVQIDEDLHVVVDKKRRQRKTVKDDVKKR